MSFRIFLLLLVSSWRHCAAQVNREEENRPPDGHRGHNDAFFALRSCHQLLRSDSGEFFSPDYLCSNPSLWCNWTIQVDPGKRIHLHLEDLTPDDDCHLKQDQVHVDEPVGRFGVHKILQKCWREAKYTTTSNTLNVVLLIGGWPDSPYRGFYGRYQAFGPPVIYNPQDVFTVGDETSEPALAPVDVRDFGGSMKGEQHESSFHPSPASLDPLYDYYDKHSAVMAEQLWPPEEAADTEVNNHLSLGNYSQIYTITAVPTAPVSTQGTSRSGRDAALTPSSHSDSPVHPVTPQEHHSHELKPSDRVPAAVRRNAEEASAIPEEAADSEHESSSHRQPEDDQFATGSEQAADAEKRPEIREASEQRPSTSDTKQAHPHPNMVEPLSDHRGHLNGRNHSGVPHLPGDHLFELTVEVNFSPDVDESWDHVATSLLLLVKTLISERLETPHTSLLPKRIKRLSAGVVFILWLQTGPGRGSQHVHGDVDAAGQSLINTSVGRRGIQGKAVIMSVSTADVNECGTQLVLCDIQAECENRFGSYACRCRPGFLDVSRLGSGGTVCVDVAAAGRRSGLSAEAQGVYVLFFLLSSLILMLLVAAGMLYRRHRRGTFLVHCSDIAPPDPSNNHHDGFSSPSDSDMLPPPPPPRAAPREAWPQGKELCPTVDLPLLRFSPLLPPDIYLEPRQSGKM